jgi:hypothetical protein
MNSLVKTVVMVVFLLTSTLFIFGGIGTIFNYQFQFSPDKLSAELPTTLIFGIGFLLIGIDSFLLFWAVYRMKKWFFVLYWTSYSLFCIFIAFILWPGANAHLATDTISLAVAMVLPLLLGMYLRKYKSKFV